MKSILFLLFVAIAAINAFELTDPVLDDNLIELINRNNVGWKAARNEKWENKTMADAIMTLRTYVNTKPDQMGIMTLRKKPVEVPSSFDARTQWPGCVGPIRNQAQCGSCWAFSAVETLSDRYCIQSRSASHVHLAAQDPVSCDQTDYGCGGGFLQNVWMYLVNYGAVTAQCWPYESQSGNAPACRNTCVNGGPWVKYYAKSGSVYHPADIATIQQDMVSSGPVQVSFTVYQDFFSYTSGVYSHQYGGIAGGHAVKFVGWGFDSSSNQPYWIVANSWGASWGLNGFFWILRGVDECGIESNAYSGQACPPGGAKC